jgi:hypothetical protein
MHYNTNKNDNKNNFVSELTKHFINQTKIIVIF